ncbi:hypothetical protein EMIT0196P_240008 [Pseudomonas chlororaphis]
MNVSQRALVLSISAGNALAVWLLSEPVNSGFSRQEVFSSNECGYQRHPLVSALSRFSGVHQAGS